MTANIRNAAGMVRRQSWALDMSRNSSGTSPWNSPFARLVPMKAMATAITTKIIV